MLILVIPKRPQGPPRGTFLVPASLNPQIHDEIHRSYRSGLLLLGVLIFSVGLLHKDLDDSTDTHTDARRNLLRCMFLKVPTA